MQLKSSQKSNKLGYNTVIDIKEELFKLKDEKFKEFHSKLIPTVAKDKIIGVKIPKIRKLGSDIFKNYDYHPFLKELPHYYYEENNVHGVLIEHINDYELCIKELERFLPYVDNWATCDMLNPKILLKNKDKLIIDLKRFLKSDNIYEIRFAIVMMMRAYKDDDFLIDYVYEILSVENNDFYVKMAKAWYLATMLSTNYDEVITLYENNIIKDNFVLNKSIQKAVESYRISKEKKQYLKTFKIK